MKKLLLFWISICSIFLAKAQLDTDHWFAPMSASAGTSQLQSLLYLSTNETTPFQVQVYNNNNVYQTVTLSKGNPQVVQIPEQFMMVTNDAELFQVNSKGIYVKGAKKFFANYRFSVASHAEIMTSKGLAGLGTEFYIAMAPLTAQASYVNATVGVTATEDNTVVTLSNINPNVVFRDGVTNVTSRTFTLNRGQSYVIDARSVDAVANYDGLIGTKLTSTHPISVTNGNFNGIYTYNNFTNNDILMDQAVPTSRLGKEFIVVKGNGSTSSGMEAILVVATQDNTQLTVNGSPITGNLNAGQYFLIDGMWYNQASNNHFNISIKTNNDAYVYQLLGGANNGTIYATGGFNFIPPLNCFLPKTIDEIPYINEIGSNSYTTKLNIITQTGANVTYNGNPIAAADGPFTVPGNADWVTYTVPSVSGTVTVNSTKSVTAGIAAGSGAVGYGGYFAGFSSIPVISKTGDCYTGIILSVDNSYDTYQWYYNGVAIPGANSFSINPELYGAGTYTCLIEKVGCGSKMTAEFVYTLCPPITEINQTIGSCNNYTITPAFTTSTQTIVPNSTQIIAQPTQGTATVNPTTGIITYTPNPGLTTNTTDTFVFYIQGNGTPFDFEYVRVNITIDVLAVNNAQLSACAGNQGTASFDLTTVNVTTALGTTLAYFEDAALTQPILLPTAYNSSGGNVYVKVTSQYNCSKTATITLNVTQPPVLDTTNFNGVLCDTNFDGIVEVNFQTITNQIVTSAIPYVVKYYLNQADALAGANNNLPNNWTYTNNTTVYIRIEPTGSNCPNVFGQISFSVGAPTTLLTNDYQTNVCDPDLNGSESVNLNNYLNQFALGATATYHNTLADAQAGINAISNIQTVSGTRIFYLRITTASGCPNTAKLNLTVVSSVASALLVDQTICPEDATTLDAGPGYTSYHWSTGETTPSINVGVGTYYVDLELNGCNYRQHVTVSAFSSPIISNIVVSGNTATVYVTGGTAPYEYSLDGVNYQPSNVFAGLPRGTHTVYVMGADQCKAVSKEFLILNILNAITPNNDGINDVLDYSDLKIKKDVIMEIYDRYGNIVFKSKKDHYIWDGRTNGSPLPTGTYWYKLSWIEPENNEFTNYSGWILLKNRE